jgi:transcriptional regulator GlxA family with amidase domain
MSFAALSVFEVANSEFGERRYDVHFISENGGPVRTSAGLMVETEPFDDSLFDTLIIGGTTEPSFTPSEGLLMYLRKAPEISRRVARPASVRSHWPKQVFSTENGRRRTGITRVNFSCVIRR